MAIIVDGCKVLIEIGTELTPLSMNVVSSSMMSSVDRHMGIVKTDVPRQNHRVFVFTGTETVNGKDYIVLELIERSMGESS